MRSRCLGVSALTLGLLLSGIVLFAFQVDALRPVETSVASEERIISSQVPLSIRQASEGDCSRHFRNYRQTAASEEKPTSAGPVSGKDISQGIRTGGGPCEYRKYNGICTITSVRQAGIGQQHAGSPYKGYDVRFRYRSERTVEPLYGGVVAREHTLVLRNSWPLGPRFLKKYGIREGRDYDCEMSVIVHGTCSPVQFDFDSIDLGDYFEIQPKRSRCGQ
jgi:hypothetical protein